MKRSDGRILTTHAGSLPRPEELTRLYVARDNGETVDEARIAHLGPKAVTWAVGKQIEAGIDVINDGEQTRDSFVLAFRNRVTGIGGSWQRPVRTDVERYPKFKELRNRIYANAGGLTTGAGLPMAIGPVSYTGRAEVEAQCRIFTEALAADGRPVAEAFFTAPSPGIVATTIRNDWYDTDDAYLAALGQALKVEYEAIVAAGFVLQIDAPDLALEGHIWFGARPRAEFVDFVGKVIDTINDAVAAIPKDRVRLHACWGNSELPHDFDVPLDDILPHLLRARVGALVLPFGNGRHAHEYKRFRTMRLADDQLLVAGVIDTLTNVVEHPEAIADRIENVARAVGDPSRVLAGTDCGFATSAGLIRVAEDVVWAKLATLAAGARLASERLF